MNTHSPSRAAETSRLRRLTDLADRVAADEWSLDTYDGGARVYVKRFNGRHGVICTFSRLATDDDVTLISGALDHLTFLLPIIARAARRFRDQEATIAELRAALDELEASVARLESTGPDPASSDKPKDYAAQASMLLVDRVFQRFLSEHFHGEVIDTKDAADAALKSLIGIDSKKQINVEEVARAAFLDLRARFSAWKTGTTEW